MRNEPVAPPAPETEDGRTAPRGRLHDHFPACLQVAVDVDVAPVISVRDADEVSFSAFIHAQDAVIAGLRTGEALAVHDGAVGDDPRVVAHVVDRPVRREREVAVERARLVRAVGRAQRVVGIGGRRAAGELHRAVLRHVVRARELHGAGERHRARARVRDLRNGKRGRAANRHRRCAAEFDIVGGGWRCRRRRASHEPVAGRRPVAAARTVPGVCSPERRARGDHRAQTGNLFHLFCAPSCRRAPLTRRADFTLLQFNTAITYQILPFFDKPKLSILLRQLSAYVL